MKYKLQSSASSQTIGKVSDLSQMETTIENCSRVIHFKQLNAGTKHTFGAQHKKQLREQVCKLGGVLLYIFNSLRKTTPYIGAE